MSESTANNRPVNAPPIPGFSLGYPQQTPKLAFGADAPAPVKMTEKYRPKTLCDVYGQGSAVCQIQAFIDNPYPCAFLFDGPTGVGKTSLALVLAAELAVDPDWSLLHIKSGEQDAESVQANLKTLRFSAPNGGWKMLIVDEAEHMSQKASQVWLSALEDLPARSIIVFTTNHPEKFQDRFLDRCERISFRADHETLSLDAHTLVSHVWRTETGRDDAPELESLPNVVDKHGNVSFRRLISAVEQVIRALPKDAPIAEVAPEPEPIPPVSRSAESILMDTIESCRYQGLVATVGTWQDATPAQRSAISRKILAYGGNKGMSPAFRFDHFVKACAFGSPVSFPEPVPAPISGGSPVGWDAIEADDTPARDFFEGYFANVEAEPRWIGFPQSTDPEPTPDNGPRSPSEPSRSEVDGRGMPVLPGLSKGYREACRNWMERELVSKVGFLVQLASEGYADEELSRVIEGQWQALVASDSAELFDEWCLSLGYIPGEKDFGYLRHADERFAEFIYECLSGTPILTLAPLPDFDPTPSTESDEDEDASLVDAIDVRLAGVLRDSEAANATLDHAGPAPLCRCRHAGHPGTDGGSETLSSLGLATIVIAGRAYGLSRTTDGYDLEKPSGESYRVTTGLQGPSCECPDYQFRREGIDSLGCKHILSLRQAGLIPPLVPAYDMMEF